MGACRGYIGPRVSGFGGYLESELADIGVYIWAPIHGNPYMLGLLRGSLIVGHDSG